MSSADLLILRHLHHQRSQPLKSKGPGESVRIHPQEGTVRKPSDLESLGSYWLRHSIANVSNRVEVFPLINILQYQNAGQHWVQRQTPL